ncbi:hypothetical protein Y032_0001g401 [Ancylostoma ceylanicum]|uniref:Uncharacterized protein n=1 Tax=Ancylostoma ceylanicum TaxID=53326 RepID=A0A016W5W6_9BILA|nr:hypothetical protein Y032_0001g401 [Ancylostoma ceylanicum]
MFLCGYCEITRDSGKSGKKSISGGEVVLVIFINTKSYPSVQNLRGFCEIQSLSKILASRCTALQLSHVAPRVITHR